MQRLLFFITLFAFSCLYCTAQINPNSLADSINARVNSISDSINAATVRMNDSLNALDNSIRKNIVQPFSPISIIKPLLPASETYLFDSLHGKLTVMVKNINKVVGNLNIALFNSIRAYTNNGPIFMGVILQVTGYTMSFTFDSVPKGVYSVAVFHDEDKNGKLGKNRMNIPNEGFGFSNNAKMNFGPPNYNETKFYFSGNNKQVYISLIYLKLPK